MYFSDLMLFVGGHTKSIWLQLRQSQSFYSGVTVTVVVTADVLIPK